MTQKSSRVFLPGAQSTTSKIIGQRRCRYSHGGDGGTWIGECLLEPIAVLRGSLCLRFSCGMRHFLTPPSASHPSTYVLYLPQFRPYPCFYHPLFHPFQPSAGAVTSTPNTPSMAKASECHMTCSGNSDETCGGSYSMDVYAQDPAYLGCFSDPAEGRMFVWESSTTAMTAEVGC